MLGRVVMVCCVSPREAKVNVARHDGQTHRNNERDNSKRRQRDSAMRERARERDEASNEAPDKHQCGNASCETNDAVDNCGKNSDSADEEAHDVQRGLTTKAQPQPDKSMNDDKHTESSLASGDDCNRSAMAGAAALLGLPPVASMLRMSALVLHDRDPNSIQTNLSKVNHVWKAPHQ